MFPILVTREKFHAGEHTVLNCSLLKMEYESAFPHNKTRNFTHLCGNAGSLANMHT
jgi:hypothetical protein